MARHDYHYRCQDVCDFVKRVGGDWLSERVVVNSAHIGWPAGKYFLMKFATEQEAAEYGYTVAKWAIDQPRAHITKQNEEVGNQEAEIE